jgi:hypothetical protein
MCYMDIYTDMNDYTSTFIDGCKCLLTYIQIHMLMCMSYTHVYMYIHT